MRIFNVIIFSGLFAISLYAQPFEKDTVSTSGGSLEIGFIGHGSLMLTYQGLVIQIDPYSQLTDYSKLPQADLVFLTHHHRDHMDSTALQLVRKKTTKIVLTEICAKSVAGGRVMKNGQTATVSGIKVEAVPAYNLVHKRKNGIPFHPKGEGNGYVLTFGDKRIYIAGDTENIPEMKQLKNIDIAFLPMNLPYTMTPEMVTAAARSFQPRVLYPYHTGETDLSKLITLLKNDPQIEIRIRKMN